MVVVDKEQKKVLVTDVPNPANRNIRKRVHQKKEKYQKLKKEQLEQM